MTRIIRISDESYHELLALKQRVELSVNHAVSFNDIVYDVCLALKRTDALALLEDNEFL